MVELNRENMEFELKMLEESGDFLRESIKGSGFRNLRSAEDEGEELGYYEGAADAYRHLLRVVKEGDFDFIQQVMDRDRRISPVFRFGRPFREVSLEGGTI